MSDYNKVSAVLSAADQQTIIKSLDSISTLLPFLVNFSDTDRKKMRKMGSKSVDYVNQCLTGAQTFPQSLKVSFDVTEFQNDVALINSLQPIFVKMQALIEGIDDTITAAGSDAMMAADEVYDELKSSANKNASVKTLVEQISQRYARQGNKTKPAATPSAPEPPAHQ